MQVIWNLLYGTLITFSDFLRDFFLLDFHQSGKFYMNFNSACKIAEYETDCLWEIVATLNSSDGSHFFMIINLYYMYLDLHVFKFDTS